MTINTRELIDAVSVVAENHNIRVTVKSSMKASAITAAATFIGAFVRIWKYCEISAFLSIEFLISFLANGANRHISWSSYRRICFVLSSKRLFSGQPSTLNANVNCFFSILGSFKSAAVIIRDELTDEQSDLLCRHITAAFRDFGPQDIAMLIPLIVSNGQFQKIIIAKLIQFITNEIGMQIIDWSDGLIET